jgi:transposase
MRRVWTLRGERPVIARQIKYQWEYLYGALGVVSGEAHFAHLPGVSLEWDQSYLRDLAASDPQAIHVLVRDQAGFHLRDGDPRLPARVRLIDLPPYSPELNPCEQLWDIIKDETCNRVHASVAALRQAMHATLQRYWQDAAAVLRLIGRDWLLAELNVTRKSPMSV